MIDNPSKKQLQESLCHLCHWKDKGEMLCHCIEPPGVIDFAIEQTGECPYVAESYWERIPKEQKDRFLNDVVERSKRYYKK